MPDIVVTEFMDEAVVAALAVDFATLYDPTLAQRPADLAAAVGAARALVVRNRTQVDRALLALAPRLQVVGRLGVGLDNIDLDACTLRGIEVCPATGANDVAVAEYVVAAALVLRRGAFMAGEAMRAGAWPREQLIGRELAGATLGLVGLGGIAREVAVRMRALEMRVLAHDPHLPAEHGAWALAEARPLEALLAQSDVVSVHVPLVAATRGLLGAEALARMRPGAILVGTARGGIIDEAALAAALRAGRLGGAALDVFATEPLTAAAAAQFVGVPNLLLTPHIAGVTVESNARISELTAFNVRRVLARA